jgi:hypothetical protein
VPRGVGVDPQRLLRVIRAVLEQPGAERQRPLMPQVQVTHGGDRGVQVQLLRDRAVRPRRLGQLPDLLKRQRRAAGRARQDQPVLPVRVRLAGRGRLIVRAVPQAEQLPVELGQAPRVSGIQDRLPDDRERLLIVDTVTLGTGPANHAPPPVLVTTCQRSGNRGSRGSGRGPAVGCHFAADTKSAMRS